MKISLTLRSAALALATCLALAGCGSDEPVAKDAAAGKVQQAEVSLDDAKAVVLDYLTKGFSGDAAACVHESAEYAAAENESMAVADCTERIESIKPMLTDGEPLIDFSAAVLTVSQGEDGGAVVDLGHEAEGFYATYRLVRQGGTWVIDSQPEATGPDGDEGAPNPDAREVPEEEAEALAAKFCAVEVGASRADVEAVLGEPTAETVDDDGTDEVDWLVNHDSYTVWFDDSDKVSQFSASSPREGDPCQE